MTPFFTVNGDFQFHEVFLQSINFPLNYNNIIIMTYEKDKKIVFKRPQYIPAKLL